MPSGPLSADIILPGYPPYGLCSDPAVRFDHWHRDPLYNHYMRLGLVEQMGVAEAYNVMNAHDFKAPTLIMHGENDGLVPSYFDVNWYNAITSKDKKIISGMASCMRSSMSPLRIRSSRPPSTGSTPTTSELTRPDSA